MNYLVMECHSGYAVVLDENGRFLKVANINYEVGQKVPYVLELKEKEDDQSRSGARKWVLSAVALAASLSIVVVGAWQFLLLPYGSVRMQINPDVRLTVDRLDYVIGLEGLNSDGEELINEYRYLLKKVDRVADELTDQAKEMGYLSEGGNVNLIVESEHENWKIATENRIILELEVHLGETITVTSDDENEAGQSDTIVIPVQPGLSDDDDDDGEDGDDDTGDDDDGDDDNGDDDTGDDDTGDDDAGDDDDGDDDAGDDDAGDDDDGDDDTGDDDSDDDDDDDDDGNND